MPYPENNVDVPLSLLDFDDKNYRYSGLIGKTQDEILTYFVENSVGYEKLKKHMQKKILASMRLLVIQNGERYTVLDGNTRLAVLKGIKPKDYKVSVIVFSNRKDAEDDIDIQHLTDLQTSWTRIRQAHKKKDKGQKLSTEDSLLLRIETHLNQMGDLHASNRKGESFEVKNCLENEKTFRPTEILVRSYRAFNPLPDSDNGVLTESHINYLVELLNKFSDGKINSDTSQEDLAEVLKDIWKEIEKERGSDSPKASLNQCDEVKNCEINSGTTNRSNSLDDDNQSQVDLSVHNNGDGKHTESSEWYVNFQKVEYGVFKSIIREYKGLNAKKNPYAKLLLLRALLEKLSQQWYPCAKNLKGLEGRLLRINQYILGDSPKYSILDEHQKLEYRTIYQVITGKNNNGLKFILDLTHHTIVLEITESHCSSATSEIEKYIALLGHFKP